MAVDGEKTDQLVALGASEDRRVHHRIIKVLALDGGVIAEDNVALVEIVSAVDFQPVLHRHADGIGNKDWHAASALGQQLSLDTNKAHRVVLVFIDVRAECRARHIGVDLIADGDNAMPDHLQCYGIDRNPTQWLNGYLAHSNPR